MSERGLLHRGLLRDALRLVLLGSLGLLLTNPAQAAEPPGSEPSVPSATDDNTGLLWEGTLSLQYRGRSTSDDSDSDLYGLLGLDVGDSRSDPFSFHFLGRGSADLDGDRDNDGGYVFDSINDTFDDSINGRIYHAYLDWRGVDELETVRLGRQLMHEGPELAWFDGLHVGTRGFTEFAVMAGVYGGVPVRLYESSTSGDWVSGAYVSARPWQRGRVRVDWMRVEEEYLDLDRDSDLVGLGLWQGLGERLQLHGNLTFLESEAHELTLRGTWADAELGLTAQVSYLELFETQRQHAVEFDPYFNSAFDYHPYQHYRVVLSQDVGEHFFVTGGADIRRLDSRSDEGQYNREFDRLYLTPTLQDVLYEGLQISVTGDYWASGGEDIKTLGADVVAEVREDLELSVGTLYSLYKYDWYADEERDDVRTWFAGLDWRWREDLRLRLDYAYEKDEFDRYQTIKVGMTWTF